jgi:hypothetical protein
VKNPILLFFLVSFTFFVTNSDAASVDELAKKYGIISVYYSVPDNDQQNFTDVVFRFAWPDKKPARIAIQFVNRAYADRKLKFAIKEVASKKMVLLDPVHNSRFGAEMLKANSVGTIWSGPVDNINDSFSLHVWNNAGDEFDKVPISIRDQQ